MSKLCLLGAHRPFVAADQIALLEAVARIDTHAFECRLELAHAQARRALGMRRAARLDGVTLRLDVVFVERLTRVLLVLACRRRATRLAQLLQLRRQQLLPLAYVAILPFIFRSDA